MRSRKPDRWMGGAWGHKQRLGYQERVKEWPGRWPSRKAKGRKKPFWRQRLQEVDFQALGPGAAEKKGPMPPG